jgi:DNA-directed RNA polymerase subunit E'/Rpb7
MDKLVSPYIDTEQYSRVALQSYQMNSDININLKFNLKKKVEKKCNKDGYVVVVHKIVEHDYGIIQPENFNASAIFNIKYSCKLCLPIEDTIIVAKIRTINKVLMVAENGPILCIVLSNNVNMENFKISSSNGFYNLKKKKELEKDDYVKINIISKTFNFGDNQIKVMAYLDDIASTDEIKKYFDTVTENENELNITNSYNNESSEESDFEKDDDEQSGGYNSNYII